MAIHRIARKVVEPAQKIRKNTIALQTCGGLREQRPLTVQDKEADGPSEQSIRRG
ncbi:hypothetical protein ACCD06_25230 [Azospirillum sp. CT11-132]|uniref:hypothetical protein n=1 Tax=Azospirillum sp. CT11-132 TaxID=3396317 RepID=UPI0039A48498